MAMLCFSMQNYYIQYKSLDLIISQILIASLFLLQFQGLWKSVPPRDTFFSKILGLGVFEKKNFDGNVQNLSKSLITDKSSCSRKGANEASVILLLVQTYACGQ